MDVPINITDIAQLGLGAVFALIVFYIYIKREDSLRKEKEEDEHSHEQKLIVLLTRYDQYTTQLTAQLISLIEANTKALAALEATIRNAELVQKMAELEARYRQSKGS